MSKLIALLQGIVFWTFFAIKAWGVTFAAWSWWWLLLPIMPFIGEAVRRFGL